MILLNISPTEAFVFECKKDYEKFLRSNGKRIELKVFHTLKKKFFLYK
jgi:hypothetical protein